MRAHLLQCNQTSPLSVAERETCVGSIGVSGVLGVGSLIVGVREFHERRGGGSAMGLIQETLSLRIASH